MVNLKQVDGNTGQLQPSGRGQQTINRNCGSVEDKTFLDPDTCDCWCQPKVYQPSHSSDGSAAEMVITCSSSSIRLSSDSVSLVACHYCCSGGRTDTYTQKR